MTKESTVQINQISNNAKASILAKLKAQVSGADYDKLPKEIPYDYPQLTHQECWRLIVTKSMEVFMGQGPPKPLPLLP